MCRFLLIVLKSVVLLTPGFDSRSVYSFTCNAQSIAFGLLEFI